MLSGSFETIQDAWIWALRHVYNEGVLFSTEYGVKARMVNGGLLEISNPAQKWHPKDPFCSPQRIKYYVKQFKRDFAGQSNFEYTYIDRLINYEGFDQLMWMRDQLMADRVFSKRIQAVSWIPKVDCLKKEDQPCFQRLWIFPYPDKTMDVHIHYRSWDLFKAYEANLMAFQELISDEFTGPCGYKLRGLRCFADNFHIYEDDFQSVEKVLC
jgi:thymidylate synthase